MNGSARWIATALSVVSLVSAAGAQARPTVPPRPNGPWPIKVREHVDLWLHGYALLSEDTSQVPLFRRGYRDSLIVVRNVAQVTSRLDSARKTLQATLASTPALVNGQLVREGDVVATGSGVSRTAYRVLKIEARRVILEREGIRSEIPLE